MPTASLLRRRARELFWFGLLPFHLTASTVILFNDAVLELTTINGSSMSPTLSPRFKESGRRDVVAWGKQRTSAAAAAAAAATAAGDVQRGDVVFFATPHRADGLAVKRVVAVGGDTVLLDPRRRPREAENGVVNADARRWDVWNGRVRVPPGHLWVEGDNWRETRDSNAYGPISRALVKGKALAVVLPLDRMGSRPWEEWESRTKVVHGVDEEVLREGMIKP